jgi:hypothetical protein
VVEEEAERVRTIFRRYLELGSLNLLMADLRERGIVTKMRSLKTGCRVGGIPQPRPSHARLKGSAGIGKWVRLNGSRH